jgi:hypothetical protein
MTLNARQQRVNLFWTHSGSFSGMHVHRLISFLRWHILCRSTCPRSTKKAFGKKNVLIVHISPKKSKLMLPIFVWFWCCQMYLIFTFAGKLLAASPFEFPICNIYHRYARCLVATSQGQSTEDALLWSHSVLFSWNVSLQLVLLIGLNLPHQGSTSYFLVFHGGRCFDKLDFPNVVSSSFPSAKGNI